MTLRRASAGTDEYNEHEAAWADLGTEWAQVFYGRGDERRQAAAEQGSQAATFQMLSNELTRGLTVKDRLSHGGAVWDLRGISLDTPRRGLIEVTATRSA